MRVFAFISFLLISIAAWSIGTGPDGDSKFEFSKPVFKIKGTIKKIDGYYVIVPDDSKKDKFVPSYLPEEYKKNGLEVTFDGDLGKADKSTTPLNIKKIWVAYELKEKYKLEHKSYELN